MRRLHGTKIIKDYLDSVVLSSNISGGMNQSRQDSLLENDIPFKWVVTGRGSKLYPPFTMDLITQSVSSGPESLVEYTKDVICNFLPNVRGIAWDRMVKPFYLRLARAFNPMDARVINVAVNSCEERIRTWQHLP